MARTASVMTSLGRTAPSFTLPDTVSGLMLGLEEVKGSSATLIMFICNHCPFVIHIQQELVKLQADYASRAVALVAISSNDAVSYPQDGPDLMKKHAAEQGFTFPYLYDETQETAKAYEAACTPDFFLYDENLRLVYRGQLDSSRPGNGIPVTGKDIREALDSLLAGKPVAREQLPSIGCNIKWKNPAV